MFPAFAHFRRTATRDTELSGQEIAAGDKANPQGPKVVWRDDVEEPSALTEKDREAIESLTDTEVDSLISSKEKLGESFIRKHVPHGMMF